MPVTLFISVCIYDICAYQFMHVCLFVGTVVSRSLIIKLRQDNLQNYSWLFTWFIKSLLFCLFLNFIHLLINCMLGVFSNTNPMTLLDIALHISLVLNSLIPTVHALINFVNNNLYLHIWILDFFIFLLHMSSSLHRKIIEILMFLFTTLHMITGLQACTHIPLGSINLIPYTCT